MSMKVRLGGRSLRTGTKTPQLRTRGPWWPGHRERVTPISGLAIPSPRLPSSLARRLMSSSGHPELFSSRGGQNWGFFSQWVDLFSTQPFASLPFEVGSCLQAALPNQDQGLARAPDGPASCATPSGSLNGEREGLRWAKALGFESPLLLGLKGRGAGLPAGSLSCSLL